MFPGEGYGPSGASFREAPWLRDSKGAEALFVQLAAEAPGRTKPGHRTRNLAERASFRPDAGGPLPASPRLSLDTFLDFDCGAVHPETPETGGPFKDSMRE